MNGSLFRSSIIIVWMMLLTLSVAACQPLVITTPITTGAMPSSPAGTLEQLVGSWAVEVTVVKQNAMFPSLVTFTGDGLVLADEPPSPFETTGHGAWVGTGPDSADYTFVALIGSETGALSATLKVAGSLRFDAAADTWQGPFQIQVVDASGAEILADDGIFAGVRITVESAEPGSQTLKVFDAFNAAVNAHDVDAALALFADDAVAQFPNQPPPNVHTGTDEIRTWLEGDIANNIHVEVADDKTAGDTVTAIGMVQVDGLPPDLVLQGIVEVIVKDGKITSFTYTLDEETLAKLQALGSE